MSIANVNEIEYAKKLGLYVHQNVASGFKLVDIDELTVWFMEGISHSYHCFKSAKNANSWFFVQLPWHHDKQLLRNCIEFFETVSGFSRERLILLANSTIELNHAISLGLKYSKFVPQNCLLDFNLIKPVPAEKKYDMAMNCRPENWKRPYLAKKVKSLAIIKGANHRPNDYFDLSLLNPQFINDERLDPLGVANILSESYCGGIFSSVEGGCYSSSEYLLMGLPVVSTNSFGGRDVWYSERNSLIVEANEDAVVKAVNILKTKLNNGEISATEIRMDHISLSNYYRSIFIEMIDNLTSPYGINGENTFENNYKHKFTRYSKINVDNISTL